MGEFVRGGPPSITWQGLAPQTRRGHASVQCGSTEIAGFSRAAKSVVGYLSQDRCEAAQACDCQELEYRAVGAPRSHVLTEREKEMISALRSYTLPPLKDRLYPLQPSIPHLTRSAPRRRLQRHGIARLPDVEVPSLENKAQCFAGEEEGYSPSPAATRICRVRAAAP